MEDGTTGRGVVTAPPQADFFASEGRALAETILEQVRLLSPDSAGVWRPAYSVTETRVLDYLEGVARSHGLIAWRDGGANLVMARPGDSDPSARCGVIGSHVDSVPQGGNFDGLAGVVTAMLSLIAMERVGIETAIPVRAIALRAEESACFGMAYVGSQALFGLLEAKALATRDAHADRSLAEAMASCGVDMARVAAGTPLIDAAAIAFFLELHIEQGPILIDRGWPVATVTGIRGNLRHRAIRCLGSAGHSGAVPRWLRHDAVMATADLLVGMDEHWSEILQQGGDLVMTAGIFHTDASHNAMSRIPGETTFSFEARSQHAATLEAVEALLHAECERVARDRGVRFDFDAPVRTPEAMLDAGVAAALRDACATEGLPTETVPSGAGHDAAIFQIAGVPSGMLFVRNANGSHNPDEAMELDDLLHGVRVMHRAATTLAGA